MQMIQNKKEDNEIFETSVPFSLEFSSLDEVLRLIRLAPFTEKCLQAVFTNSGKSIIL